MLDPIGDGEGVGEDSIPTYVGALVDIHDDQEANEDLGKVESDELAKECAELHHIECLTVVHEATKDLGADD